MTLLNLLVLVVMLNQDTLGPALPLPFNEAATLPSFGQLLFNLLGEVLAELLAVHCHPLSLNVHLGIPTKGLSHLEESLRLMLCVRMSFDLSEMCVILVPRFLHRVIPRLLVLFDLLELRVHKSQSLLCFPVFRHLGLTPLHGLQVSTIMNIIQLKEARA